MKFSPKPCAEFPNDNPDLHDGASWICSWTRAKPRALVSARGVARLMADKQDNVRVVSAEQRAEDWLKGPVSEERLSSEANEYVATPKPPANLREAVLSATVEAEESAEPSWLSEDEPLVEFTPALPDVGEAALGDSWASDATELTEASAEQLCLNLDDVAANSTLEVAPPPAESLEQSLERVLAPLAEQLEAPAQPAANAHVDLASDAEDIHTAPTLNPAALVQDTRAVSDAATAPRQSQEDSFDPFVAELDDLMAPLRTSAPPALELGLTEAASPEAASDLVPEVPCRLADVQSLRTSEFAPASASSADNSLPSLEELAAQVSPPPPRVSEMRSLVSSVPPNTSARDTEIAAEAAPTTIASAMSLLQQSSPSSSPSKRPSFKVPRPEAVLAMTPEPEDALLIDIDLTPEPPGLAGWQEVCTLVESFLLEQGATRAAAISEPLLLGQPTDLSRLSTRVAERLLNSGIAELQGSKLLASADFREQAIEYQDSFSSGGADPDAIFDWVCGTVHALIASDAAAAMIETRLENVGLKRLLKRAA